MYQRKQNKPKAIKPLENKTSRKQVDSWTKECYQSISNYQSIDYLDKKEDVPKESSSECNLI